MKLPEQAVDYVARKLAPAAYDPLLPPRVAESWQREARVKAADMLANLMSLGWRPPQ